MCQLDFLLALLVDVPIYPIFELYYSGEVNFVFLFSEIFWVLLQTVAIRLCGLYISFWIKGLFGKWCQIKISTNGNASITYFTWQILALGLGTLFVSIWVLLAVVVPGGDIFNAGVCFIFIFLNMVFV